MSDRILNDQEKIDEYFSIIQERILKPLQETEVRQYCTATLLILFAAIDGLGNLLHPKDYARPKQRIKQFLVYMGGDYKVRNKELVQLRNSLVHESLNVDTFLSYVKEGGNQHLQELGAAGFIYVNTSDMYKDFVNAFEKFRKEIYLDPVMMKRAADRLKVLVIDPSSYPDTQDITTPSAPSPITFIFKKPKMTLLYKMKMILKIVFSKDL